MTKAFRERLMREITVDTRTYRYTVKQNVRTWKYEILRIRLTALDTTEAIDGWELVEVIN